MSPTLILNWDTMTPRGRAVAIIGIFVTLLKFWDALIDKTVARLAAGKPPVDPSETPSADVMPSTSSSSAKQILQRLFAPSPLNSAAFALTLTLIVLVILK